MENYQKLTENGLRAMFGTNVVQGIITNNIDSYNANKMITIYGAMYRLFANLTDEQVDAYNTLGEDELLNYQIKQLFEED